MALWSARRRGGLYIEPEDLLHALIREDRGELAAIHDQVFPDTAAAAPSEFSVSNHTAFFSDDVARTLLQELHEDPDPVSREKPAKLEPVPHADMPVSRSLKEVLAVAARAHKDDTETIEPLDLLAGIVENRESHLAQLLRECGITRQKVAKALDSGR
jgi:ATP-dependent Clp protease ATP-binding subunit ClpA